ncbi:major facilitator super transporter protein [Lunasporangiospora selenospora]|uniref:GPI ethanolamine phosphate transferase 2 n=1 Tax=Lunasporangiospora selenospora TaxID=979761 RepID=A0A9P6G394_9FUNG|nr:major facilitator super transporter protein [Lunasporangiospora selenospora]
MLVDALRSDFLYDNKTGFQFMQSLVDQHKAIPFTALASAPTATLPRLKALATGAVPGFLDAILNIAESDQSSTLANQDNWIAQFVRSRSQRLDMQTGEPMNRTDTVEVDTNVTRHVEPEMLKDDWDGLILHYLGLDHVGHSGGSKSPLMHPKQIEMDNVAETIYGELLRRDAEDLAKYPQSLPTLFILCGDHGMNEIGNHGGSSKSEISTAFLFMSSAFTSAASQEHLKTMIDPYKCNQELPGKDCNKAEDFSFYRTVNQIDLVPTLSLLLGLPIPKNNVGRVIPELLSEYSASDKLRALQINAHQVAEVLKSKWPNFKSKSLELLEDFKDGDESYSSEKSEQCSRHGDEQTRLQCWYTLALADHASYLSTSRANFNNETAASNDYARQTYFNHAEQAYNQFLSDASSMLSTALSKYDMPLLTNGSMLMAFAVAGMIFCAFQTNLLADFKLSCVEPDPVSPPSLDHRQYRSQALHSISRIAATSSKTSFSTLRVVEKTKNIRTVNEINWLSVRVLGLVILVLYLITLFASSFVEEEHQFWYFFGMTWWTILGLTSAHYVTGPTDEATESNPGLSVTLPDRNPTSEIKATGLRSGFTTAKYCFLQMILLRILRSWNQTGQKYADQIDLRHYLNSSWQGFSWTLFWMSMVVLTALVIALVYSTTTKYQLPSAPARQRQEKGQDPTIEAWRSAAITITQGLLAIAAITVSLWITVYKMDLEAAYIGEPLMRRVHGFMSTISQIGYPTTTLPKETPIEKTDSHPTVMLEFSGYEMARGCYAALGLILLLSLVLARLSVSNSVSQRIFTSATEIRHHKAALLFMPSMVLGVVTFLLILLSRRHNAPVFVLFVVQLWAYLKWIECIRQRPSNTTRDNTGDNRAIFKEENGSENVQENESAELDAAIEHLSALRQYRRHFRTLPGLGSIHSCTLITLILSSFFILGNSNSIASIDISNSYVGIRSYNIVLTGVLTFVSNWAGPIWWAFASVVVLRWDIEWELGWIREEEALLSEEHEEKMWKTVKGWRIEDKNSLTKRTKKRIASVRAIMKKQKKESQQEDVPTEKAKGKDEREGEAYEEPWEETKAQDQGADIVAEKEHEDDTFYVYEEQELDPNDPAEAGSRSIGKLLDLSNITAARRRWTNIRVMDHLIVTTTFFAIALYALSIAAVILRHHLFIWTVFSPKVLYQCAWTVLFQLIVQVLIVGGCSIPSPGLELVIILSLFSPQ